MNSELLSRINDRLNCLHTILSKIIPLTDLSSHPLKYFDYKYKKILNCIDEIIKEAEREKEEMILDCIKISKEIEMKSINIRDSYNENLYMNCNETIKKEMIQDNNLYIYKELLLNELNRIILVENELKAEINLWIAKIFEIHIEIYNLPYKQNESINLEYLDFLKKEHERLKEEKIKKELKRGEMTKQIKKYSKLLEIKYPPLIKISEIEETYNLLTELCKEREKQISLLKIEILSKETLLCNNRFNEDINDSNIIKDVNDSKLDKDINQSNINKDINDSSINDSNINNCLLDNNIVHNLSERYLNYLKNYLISLENEYNKRIDEIYTYHMKKLLDLLDLFGMDNEYYEKSNEGLVIIQKRIHDLELKKNSFLEITNMIEKRSQLLESMNEFEKIASDPRRLFKSSFQLNKEEKFRKNAFPTLLKIEKGILNLISEHNTKFDKFYINGKDFEDKMKKEIDNRIVNKTVFINKFDSPYKRK